jgi:hypothetical protein
MGVGQPARKFSYQKPVTNPFNLVTRLPNVFTHSLEWNTMLINWVVEQPTDVQYVASMSHAKWLW